MSRFGSTSYNPTGDSSSNGGDYKERDSMLLDRYAIIEFDLARVGTFDGNFGQQLILNMDDVEVREGVVTERDEDEKMKVFGWDKWYDRDEETKELIPFDDGGDITIDDLGRKVTESAGGDNYKYAIEEGVLEGRDDPVDIGDRELWLSNAKKTRTLAKVLSEHGEEVIDEDNKDDDFDWLATGGEEDFNLRDELEGRRMMLWFENVTIDISDEDEEEEVITFTDSVLLDAETETGIKMKNGDGDSSSGANEADDSNDENDSDGDSDEDWTGKQFPEGIEELVDMFARNGQTNRESIESIVTEEAPEDYEVDMDAVMKEIKARQ